MVPPCKGWCFLHLRRLTLVLLFDLRSNKKTCFLLGTMEEEYRILISVQHSESKMIFASRKLIWHWKYHLKMYLLLKMVMFHSHVGVCITTDTCILYTTYLIFVIYPDEGLIHFTRLPYTLGFLQGDFFTVLKSPCAEYVLPFSNHRSTAIKSKWKWWYRPCLGGTSDLYARISGRNSRIAKSEVRPPFPQRSSQWRMVMNAKVERS